MPSLSVLLAESGVPGLANIASTRRTRRILWTLAFVVLSGFMCHDLYKLFNDYISYPVTVTVKVADSRVLPFPAVTVCNLNPVQKDSFCSNPDIKKPPVLEKLLCVNVEKLLANKQCTLPDFGLPSCSSDFLSFLSGKKRKKRQLSGDLLVGAMNIAKNFLPNLNSGLTDALKNFGGNNVIPDLLNGLSGGAFDGLSVVISKALGLENLGLGGLADVKTLFSSNNITNIVKAVAPLFQQTLQETTGCNLGTSDVPEELIALLQNITSSMKSPICLITPDGLKMLSNVAQNLKDQLSTCATTIMDEFDLNENNQSPFWKLTNSLKSFLSTLERTDRDQAKKLGQSWENLILSCSYEGKDCTNSSLFTQVFYSSYGNCYTFNFHEDEEKRQRSTRLSGFTGPRYGLELLLNLNTSQYMPTTKETGVKIIIHSPFLRADTDQDLIHVPPGVVTYIGVRMVNITRLEHPYPDKCSDDWKSTDLLKWSLNLNYGYTAQVCLKFCFQKNIIEQCHCFTTSTPIPSYYKHIPECELKIPGNKTCLENMRFKYYNGELECDCPPRCREISYEKAVSTAKETKQCQLLKDPNRQNQTQDVSDTEKVKAVIYFQSMSYEEILQEPKYSRIQNESL
ncbi:degenerin-like protein unc-105 isoform X2 [Tachypleus tridentatus]|uniref:degenerin-like protein unc-105 isoform X2 n=2 Tax=Tachypleus tridentatus TaxID=6853 RepID=UPI003FCFFE9F